MAWGPDEEFRAIFRDEAEGRLERMTDLLLHLERGGDGETLAQLLREAHTLKGAAGVVGVDPVLRVAHVMEDVLDDLRHGRRVVTPALIEGLLHAVDRLETVLPGVLAGEDGGEAADAVIDRLRGLDPTAPSPAGATEVEPGGAVVAPHEPVGPGDAEVVRVPMERAEELNRLAGEAATAARRVAMLVERLESGATPTEVVALTRVVADLQAAAARFRMVPAARVVDRLRRAVRDLARASGKLVELRVVGETTELDRAVLDQLADPLLHLVRNAVDHGVEPPEERRQAGKPAQATVVVTAAQRGNEVVFEVADDGRGIDVGLVRASAAAAGIDAAGLAEDDVRALVFHPGVSTAAAVTEVSGRGVGLDVVRARVTAVRGRVEVGSVSGQGTTFRLAVPLTLAVLPCAVIEVAGRHFALPTHTVVSVLGDGEADSTVEGREAVRLADEVVTVSRLDAALALDAGTRRPPGRNGAGVVVVVAGAQRRHAFRVDAVVGHRDVTVEALSPLLPRLDAVLGTSLEPDGSVMPVLDGHALVELARRAEPSPAPAQEAGRPVPPEPPAGPRRPTVLVVDDAYTVRELERGVLERAGYVVVTAADGADALRILGEEPIDLVMSDIEMPGMDGLALTRAIRADPRLASVPVVVLSVGASLDDRRRGLEAGADLYLVKSSFDQQALLLAVERFLGSPPR